MRGTSNTGAGKVTGDVLPAASVNDLLKIAVGADDDSLAELLAFEPPAGVTSTTPRVGFLALRNGPVVTGDGAARNVNVVPIRAIRSSIDNALPREALSAITTSTTTVAMPAVVGAGLWRLELLYAQIAYVDASHPEKGTTCTLAFAPTAAGAVFAGAPTVATIPANTSTTWNVPVAYVKNVNGATTIANEDILPAPASVVGGFAQDLQARLLSQKTGIDARRAYSSANHSPLKLVASGGSAFVGSQILTSTVTPLMLGRPGAEVAIREILLPTEQTGPNGGAGAEIVIDDTRDWRGANFDSVWWCGQTATFAEDDNSIAGAQPTTQTAGTPSWMYLSTGQSWVAHDPAGSWVGGSALWAATIGVDAGASKILGPTELVPTGDAIGLTVHATTGALQFYRKVAGGAANGPPIRIKLTAVFGNHRA